MEAEAEYSGHQIEPNWRGNAEHRKHGVTEPGAQAKEEEEDLAEHPVAPGVGSAAARTCGRTRRLGSGCCC